MHHIYQQGLNSKKPTLLLLHGTGGNETSLLPIGPKIDSEASILSLRGNVLENGMPRFFRRLSEGVFDEEDLILRTKELSEFLDVMAKQYSFDRGNIVAIGYSNGANIAASLLFHYANTLRGAILHHPMVPLRGIQLPNLDRTPVFIAAGTNDPICSAEESKELQKLLEDAAAHVTIHWEENEHRLTEGEVQAASTWYRKAFS